MFNNIKIKNFLMPIAICILSLFIFDAEAILFSNPSQASCKWDCHWYIHIAQFGYEKDTYLYYNKFGMAGWPFFPAYPMLVRFVHYIIGYDYYECGLILNQALLFFLMFITLFYAKKFCEIKNEVILAFILLMSPFSVWYKIQYTECLYGILVILACIFTKEKKYISLSVVAFFLSLTRPTGVFVVLACSLYLIYTCLKNKEYENIINYAFPTVVGSLGVSSYMLFLYKTAGDALAFSHIEISWGKHLKFPGAWIVKAIVHLKKINGVISSFIDIFFIRYGFKNNLHLEALILMITFLLAISEGVESMHRYIMGNPLFSIILCIFLNDKSKMFRKITLSLLFATGVLVNYFWFYGAKYFF